MTTISKPFQKTTKQIEAIRLMSEYPECMFEGGSRSGKTFIIIYAFLCRAIKYPNSKHLLLRKHFNHIKASIWHQTLPAVLKICFPDMINTTNKTDYFIELTNGSQLWLSGTDDKERIEKLLGQEWDSIFLNEVSQISYNTYETVKTRLNPQQGTKPLFVVDQNPGNRNHWANTLFNEKKDPETKQSINDTGRYASLKMNPKDNIENLSEGYISNLESMSEKKRRRFLLGEYTDDSENALWKREWIIKNRLTTLPELKRIVIAVDPAVSSKDTSCETGIVIGGTYTKDKQTYYVVIDDISLHGAVTEWGQIIAEAYTKYRADSIVGEVNNGGDLVEANIRNYDKYIKYESVRATRGKYVRAEPIADLYRRGLVSHFGEFTDLENQMCEWTEDSDVSPDRMDALVWLITYLSGSNGTGLNTLNIPLWN